MMQLGFFLLVAAVFGLSSANFKCACNLNHPEVAILACPDDNSKVIGYMYQSDQNNPFHPIRVTSDPTCKPISKMVKPIPSWITVVHFGQVGFIHKDTGVLSNTCQGQTHEANALNISECAVPIVTNRPVQTTTTPVADTTHPDRLVQTTTTAIADTIHPDRPVQTTTAVADTIQPDRPVQTTTTAVADTIQPGNIKRIPYIDRPVQTTTTALPDTTHPARTDSPPAVVDTIQPDLFQDRPVQTTTTPVADTTHPGVPSVKTQAPELITEVPPHNQNHTEICNKMEMIMDLARHQHVEHHWARQCSSGTFESEAVVMKYCHAPQISQWHPGPKVIDNCNSIPRYAPISLFAGNVHIGKSAIFLQCTGDGHIQLLRQSCSVPMSVQTVSETASLYHVILW